MNKKQKMRDDILKHGLQLERQFGNGSSGGPVSLCKALHRIETRTHHKAEDMCNGTIEMPDAVFNKWYDRIVKRVSELLPGLPKEAIKINTDPRGYALKIEDSYIRENNIDLHRDWGGYGILAPDFD
jgi:hypothetical protein